MMSSLRLVFATVTDVSPLMTLCVLFVYHMAVNSMMLSPINSLRCFAWNKEECSADEAWILNWFSFAHGHVSALLLSMIHVAMDNKKLETVLSYTMVAIIFVYFAEGIFVVDVLQRTIAYVQAIIFGCLAIGVCYITNQNDKKAPAIPLPRKIGSSSSYSQRNKISVAFVATTAQFVAGAMRVASMTFSSGDSGRNSYIGDMSSPVFQAISSMALCDMMLATALLGVALRFFESDDLKVVLWFQAGMLLVSQAVLSGKQGDMITHGERQAGSIGNFVSILVAVLGAL